MPVTATMCRSTRSSVCITTADVRARLRLRAGRRSWSAAASKSARPELKGVVKGLRVEGFKTRAAKITSVQLYAGPSGEFIEEAVQKRIAEKLGDSFYDYYRFRASASEFTSWKNSLAALAHQLRYSNMQDHGVVLELQLPSSSARLDCLVFGRSKVENAPAAVLIELKQWTEAMPSEWDGCVESFVGGAVRKVLHPSLQALTYSQYLQDTSPAYDPDREGIPLTPCSWLHNMHPGASGALRGAAFRELLDRAPMFVSSDADRFGDFLGQHVGRGRGVDIMDAALSAPHSPSKKLLDYTTALVAGEPAYRLIDEQVVAYNAVLSLVRKMQRGKTGKAVVLVKGGPGTGKSLIALNLLGTLSRFGLNVQHATGSKAFTQNIWRVLGSRSKAQVKYFNSYSATAADGVDVLLADEAHRIRTTSNNRFTSAARRSERSQIDELIDVAKVSVFFIDDFQTVRPGEVGSAVLIREAAVQHDVRCEEVDLRAQFRCAGSDEYIDWIDQLLEIRKTGVERLEEEKFEFAVLEDPADLDEIVRAKLAGGNTARLMAGYCWPWSDPNENGDLRDDVVLGRFHRPWNAKPEARKLRKGIPPAPFWASDPGGVDQVGCVYTAQGFEFDYAGVIWGGDLVRRGAEWVGRPSASHDRPVKTRAGARFTDCVKNTYRVLLTRGLRGCYVCIPDAETRDYVRGRVGVRAL